MLAKSVKKILISLLLRQQYMCFIIKMFICVDICHYFALMAKIKLSLCHSSFLHLTVMIACYLKKHLAWNSSSKPTGLLCFIPVVHNHCQMV